MPTEESDESMNPSDYELFVHGAISCIANGIDAYNRNNTHNAVAGYPSTIEMQYEGVKFTVPFSVKSSNNPSETE